MAHTIPIPVKRRVRRCFILCVGLAASQALAGPPNISGNWLLDETSLAFPIMDYEPAMPPPREITMEMSLLSDNDRQIWAVDLTGQCNAYGAKLELSDDNTPAFSSLVKTTQYCPDWRRDYDKVLTATVFGAYRIQRMVDGIIFFSSARSLRFIPPAE